MGAHDKSIQIKFYDFFNKFITRRSSTKLTPNQSFERRRKAIFTTQLSPAKMFNYVFKSVDTIMITALGGMVVVSLSVNFYYF